MSQTLENAPFIEPLPPEVEGKLRDLKPASEEVLIQVATDLGEEGQFSQSWLVVTQQRLFFLDGEPVNGSSQIGVDQVHGARVEALIGGGLLEVQRREGPPTRLRYSSTLAPKFAEVAEGINRLAKGESMALPSELEQSRCSRCGRLLPEKNGLCPACVKKWDTLKRLAGYLWPYRRRAVLLVLVTVFGTLLDLLPPLVVGRIIDDVLDPLATTGDDAARLGLLGLLVLGLLVIRAGLWAGQVGRGWQAVWLASQMVANIRRQLYERLQYLPLRFYDKRRVGALMARITNDTSRVEGFLIDGLPFIVTNALMIAGILGFLTYMSWQLTIYVLVPVPAIVGGGWLIWTRMRNIWTRWSAKWSRFYAHLNESISGIRMVKAFTQEEREAKQFDQRNDELRQISVEGDRNIFVFFTAMNFVMSFGVFFVWYFGGRQILHQQLTLGVLMAFISYIWMLYQPLKWFGELTNWMSRAFAGAERVFEVIDSQAEEADAPDSLPLPRLEGRVAFRDVYFGYDRAKPVLKGFELEVRPGEMIGLVGRSGVGKSTLVNLVCRFYDADRGSVEIDGMEIRKVRLRDLRRQIGLVHQQSFLFDGTVLENIRYAKPEATFSEVVRAARAANAHEFIIAKPDGYDTMVGEQGNKLSGGEKQRVAIARAILHDPRILILDEATSSLDTSTEKKIQEAIGRLAKGRTTFAIAHRLSTLRSADRLVVIEDGKVAEVGTHQELMAREGVFANLVKTQQEVSAVVAVGGSKEQPA
ncbi:MAG: ABC transporter ATP-binding protein [Candidatus Latescibacteria bacterium]|nr:ABC transporter ATP-binding protein [Candidatus Latescibacterota bacterium]